MIKELTDHRKENKILNVNVKYTQNLSKASDETFDGNIIEDTNEEENVEEGGQ